MTTQGGTMNVRNLGAIATVCVFSLVGTAVWSQAKPNFVGTWRAVQPTGGITAARIFQQTGGLQVQLWGACKPSDCDWGIAPFRQLPDAESKLLDRGFASFSGSHTTFRIDGSELVIELYRVPEAGSKVTPHFGIIRLTREK